MEYPQLNDFVQALKLVRRPPANLFDMGLLIREKKNKTTLENIKIELQNDLNIKDMIYDGSVSDKNILKQIVKAFNDNSWVLMELKKDLDSTMLNQLQHLSNSNNLQIMDFQGQEVFEMDQPEKSRLIILADRDFIEKKITYPNFYKLFGPTLNLN